MEQTAGMRGFVIAIALIGSACSLEDLGGPLGDDGDDGAASYACGDPPDECPGRNCITQTADFGPDDCCDSRQCNCNPETLEWETWFCEAPPPDAPWVPDAEPAPDSDLLPPVDAATAPP